MANALRDARRVERKSVGGGGKRVKMWGKEKRERGKCARRRGKSGTKKGREIERGRKLEGCWSGPREYRRERELVRRGTSTLIPEVGRSRDSDL